MNIEEMKSEVYAWAVTKGWEPDAGRTFADECTLLATEVSEAVDAYRKWRFEDATNSAHGASDGGYLPNGPDKPEGVGSELADVLVRICHYAKRRGFTLLQDNYPIPPDYAHTFGTECMNMHDAIARAFQAWKFDLRGEAERWIDVLLVYVLYSCELHSIDLEWEFRRKMDYNRTRAWRHGNRAM